MQYAALATQTPFQNTKTGEYRSEISNSASTIEGLKEFTYGEEDFKINATEVQELEKLAGCENDPLINYYAQRIAMFPDFDNIKNDLSELFLRDVQSCIINTVFKLLQRHYTKSECLSFCANQAIEGSQYKPDSIIYYHSPHCDFGIPLLVAEDKKKFENFGEFNKILTILRIETKKLYVGAAERKREKEIIHKYRPIAMVTNQLKFRFGFFVKDVLCANDSLTLNTKRNNITPIDVTGTPNPTREILDYSLNNLQHMYFVTKKILAMIQQSIKCIENIFQSPKLVDVKVIGTPKHSKADLQNTSAIYSSFVLSNNQDFMYVDTLKGSTHKYESQIDEYVVKYINKMERDMLRKALDISKDSVVEAICVKLVNNSLHDYLIIMPFGRRFERIIHTFTEFEMNQIICTLLKTVDTFHKHRLIHRDIKMDNLILINKKLYFVDFGLSLQFDTEDESGRIKVDEEFVTQYCGTNGYIAPEIDDATPYGTKIDCFSCGVVILFAISKITKEEITCKKITCESAKLFFEQIEEKWTFKLKEVYKRIVFGLLQENPQNRFSALEALEMFTSRINMIEIEKVTPDDSVSILANIGEPMQDDKATAVEEPPLKRQKKE